MTQSKVRSIVKETRVRKVTIKFKKVKEVILAKKWKKFVEVRKKIKAGTYHWKACNPAPS